MGFIGSNLMTQHHWDATFSRVNASHIGGHFDTVVCCAAPGTKWKANADPVSDLNGVTRLVHSLAALSAQKFILISTADVFGQPVDADEGDDPNPDCAYGHNRHWLERQVVRIFPNVSIIRLPGVVGPGLKKNPIYDMQNEHRLEHLNPDSVYQWYDVRNLWGDIKDVTVPVLHMCPEPESLAETVCRDYPHLVGRLTGAGTPARYNLRTKYPRA